MKLNLAATGLLFYCNSVAATAEIVRSSSKQPTAQTVRFGERAIYGPASIRPLRLLVDSRCPIDVLCFWAGRLKILVEVAGGTKRDLRVVTFGEALRLSPGLWVTLALVCPERETGKSIPRKAYQFAFLPGTSSRPKALDAMCQRPAR